VRSSLGKSQHPGQALTFDSSGSDNNTARLEFVSVPEFVGVTGLSYALILTGSILRNFSKIFLNSKTLLCLNLINKFARSIQCHFYHLIS
jgi:hypothetical protein